MPCRDYDWPDSKNTVHADDYAAIKRDLDNVTRLLCGLIGQVEDAKTRGLHSDHIGLEAIHGLEEWWVHHQQRDAENSLQEKTKLLISLKERIKKIQQLGGNPSPELLEKFEHTEAEVKDLGTKVKKATIAALDTGPHWSDKSSPVLPTSVGRQRRKRR